MKQIKLLAIAIVFSVSASATSFGELTENWLQSPGTSGEPQRIGNGGGPDPGLDKNGNTPVGEGLLFLTALAGSYMVFRRYAGKRQYSRAVDTNALIKIY